MRQPVDIVIAGSGPSALLLGVHCAERGLRTLIAAPDPETVWVNQYACWRDELPVDEAISWGELLVPEFSSALVWLEEDAPRVLERGYGRLEGTRLHAMLWDRFVRAGGQTCHGRVLAVEHLATGIRAETDAAELIRGAVFVDATGHQSRFIRRQAGDVTGYQLAYGILADVEGEPASSDRMTLMDYRGETPRDDIPNPSFLYAFQRESGLWFMEETVLVGTNATSFGTLKSRLENRLERQGVKVRRVLEQEHCLIPMNPPLPRVRQRSLGFGGAASMVHPASGYMVAHSASLAPKVAESLLVGLGSYKGEPREAVREAWNVIWPRTARQSHALYRLGSTILSEFDAPTIRAFFQAFFEQPGDRWRGYLSRTLGVSGVMASMWGTFGELRPGVRKAMFAALARNPMESWQSIRGGLVE